MRRITFIVLMAIAALIAACSSPAASTAPSAAASPSAPASVAPSVEPSTPASEEPSATASDDASGSDDYPLEVGQSGPDLVYLTGVDGMTLYTFKNDTKDSGKSTCNGGCADNWPPYLLEGDDEVTPGDGVSGTIGTVTRDDGTTMVSYNGWPLYYFAGDAAAGDTKGEGLNDVWFVAAP